ncbi:amidohydrolase family protein [Persicobacter psychrovividus]|uniref:Amidohydrolase n=1 Tax=Persicobacter psychrovividus TaxID=387638 RepID=A0ABM7VN06_9BACT|nr:amidohydrolase [Persicobacter psychrovividus]
MITIDSHHHLWVYDPAAHDWISDEMSCLRQDFTGKELEHELSKANIDYCVAVQASQTEEETIFLLDQAAKCDRILGVVGWVDLCAESVPERLAHFSENPSFVGVRHVLQDEQDDAFMLRPDFVNGIAQLEQFNLTYDLLIFPRHLENAFKLVKQFPNQKFVIDHLAKPAIKAGEIDEWKKGMAKLAQCPNVYCKLSGMVTEADWLYWVKTDFSPYIYHLLEIFGADRLMFGSDWPVCTLAASYRSVRDLLNEHLEGELMKRKIFGENAIRFYNLKPKQDSVQQSSINQFTKA